MHRDGSAHTGLTYVYGAPGVGKSFLVRNHLAGAFPGKASCVVKLGEVFGAGPSGFRLGNMLSASGCARDGALRPLLVIGPLASAEDPLVVLLDDRLLGVVALVGEGQLEPEPDVVEREGVLGPGDDRPG